MKYCKDCIHYERCEFLGGDIPDWRLEDYKYDVLESLCRYFRDRSLVLDLPCAPGTHLWRITTPYRGEPKVTEYVVKNFRTTGKRRKLQIEVQAVNVPGTNWMQYRDFYQTAEEAEKAIAERRG